MIPVPILEIPVPILKIPIPNLEDTYKDPLSREKHVLQGLVLLAKAEPSSIIVHSFHRLSDHVCNLARDSSASSSLVLCKDNKKLAI